MQLNKRRTRHIGRRGLSVHLSLPFCLCLCLVLWGSSQFQNGPKALSYKIIMCEEGGRKAFSQSQLSGPLLVMAGDKMKSSQFHGFRTAELHPSPAVAEDTSWWKSSACLANCNIINIISYSEFPGMRVSLIIVFPQLLGMKLSTFWMFLLSFSYIAW